MVSAPAITRRRLSGAASPECAPELAAGGACTVLGVFPAAAYVRVGEAHDGVVALLRPDALRLPNGVRLPATTPDLRGLLAAGDTGDCAGGSLRVGGLTVTVAGTWQPPRVRRLAPAGALPAVPAPDARTPEVAALGADPALRAEAAAVARALAAGDAAGLDALLGRGPGLTPTGDDVACGIALVAAATGAVDAAWLGARLAERGRRTTSLSARLLACAARGLAVPQVVALVDDLLAPGAAVPAARVAAVHAIGHSSGRDLCAGLAGAVDAWAPGTGRPAPENTRRPRPAPETTSRREPR